MLRLSQAVRGQAQQQGGEIRAQHLRLGEGAAPAEILLRIQAQAQAGTQPAAAALALVGTRARYGLYGQSLQAAARTVAADSRQPGIDDGADAGYGNRSLGHVGRQHDPLPRAALKYPALLFPGQPRIQFEHLHLFPQLALQELAHVAYLALAGQKYQNVAAADLARFGDDFSTGLEHRGRQVGILLLLIGGLAIADFDRVAAPDHRDDRSVIEESRDALHIQCRRGHDEFQIRPPRQQLLQHPEQQIDIERALMRLIDDDGVVTPQPGVGGQLRQQQPVGHQQQTRGVRRLIGEAHAKADAAPERLAHFLGDARGQGARREPPRLRVCDQGVEAAPQFQAVLRQLRALSRARIAGDDQYLIAAQRLHDGFAPRRDRQLRIVLESQRHCRA